MAEATKVSTKTTSKKPATKKVTEKSALKSVKPPARISIAAVAKAR